MKKPYKYFAVHRITKEQKEFNYEPQTCNFEEWEKINDTTSKKVCNWDFYIDNSYPAKLRLYNYIQSKEVKPIKQLYFNNELLTPETIKLARQHFIDICNGCINEAITGVVRVNNLQDYIQWQENSIKAIKAGNSDHTFTFLQRAYWLQTGNCIGLLGNG